MEERQRRQFSGRHTCTHQCTESRKIFPGPGNKSKDWKSLTDLCSALPEAAQSKYDGPLILLNHLDGDDDAAEEEDMFMNMFTLIQRQREMGRVTRMQRMEMPVRRKAAGPGPSGSAEGP